MARSRDKIKFKKKTKLLLLSKLSSLLFIDIKNIFFFGQALLMWYFVK